MTIHEQTVQAELVRSQVALLNDTLALCHQCCPSNELAKELVLEILRLSRCLKP